MAALWGNKTQEDGAVEYKGYYIAVSWNNKELGFDFTVYDPEHRQVARSSEAYFFDYNAEKGAKEIVDKIFQKEKIGG